MSRTNTWMPLYVADYLADTTRLNAAQHGAYMLLLMEIWRNGPVANVPSELAMITKTDVRTWSKDIWPTLKRFFQTDDDGNLYQKRLLLERQKAEEISNKRREAVQQRKDRQANKPPANTQQEDNNDPTNVGSNEHTRALSRDNHNYTSSLRSEDPSLRSGGASSDASTGQAVAVATKATKTKRACRLAENWHPTPEQIQFARDNGVDPVKTAAVFRDYWLGVPGSRGSKLDWDATWRNWVRRDQDIRPTARPTQADRRAAVNAAWAGVPDIEGV